MTWTDERIETLKKLYDDGLSASQIAAELGGVTRNAVIGKVCRLGLQRTGVSQRLSRPQPRHKPQPRKTVTRLTNHGNRFDYVEVKAPAPLPIEDGAIPVGQRCTLLDLTSKTCRWPIGTPGDKDFFFCGGPSDNNLGQPYCSYHSHAAYQPATVRRVRRPYIPGRIAA